MRAVLIGLAAAIAFASTAMAQDEPATLKDLQAARFPQPVRVGSLAGEKVIEPGEHLKKLGVVVGVFKPADGELQLVFRYGGVFGLGARVIAPPVEEVSLVGPMVKINDLDKKDLQALPTFDGKGGAFLAANDTIKVGVDRKY